MKRENIEKKASEVIERIIKPYEGKDKDAIAFIMKTNFVAAAEWRINSVWHDVDKELPEYNRHVVNEDWFDFTAKDEKDLKRIMNQYSFKRWAYVEDLMPNKEE